MQGAPQDREIVAAATRARSSGRFKVTEDLFPGRKTELGTAERTFWLRSFKSRPDSHPPARLSFQRSQGQADAGNHSIPGTLFLLGIRKIKAMDCCARTR